MWQTSPIGPHLHWNTRSTPLTWNSFFNPVTRQDKYQNDCIFLFQVCLLNKIYGLKVTPAVYHSWTEAWGGLQIQSHMFGEGTEGWWFFWHAPIGPGRVVVLRYRPGCRTVSLEHGHKEFFFSSIYTCCLSKQRSRDSKSSGKSAGISRYWSMGAPSSHLSEVNAGDKIIRTLFTAQRGHLDKSIINSASFWGPVFFTQHLQANK